MAKVYAYVQSETCGTRAVAPGTIVQDTPVSKHGDYVQWTRGKRATLGLIESPEATGWLHRAAVSVADLMFWN